MTTALLMIDVQEGMWMESKPPHNDKAFLKNAAALLEKARSKGVPIIHIQHDGGQGDVLHEGHDGFAPTDFLSYADLPFALVYVLRRPGVQSCISQHCH